MLIVGGSTGSGTTDVVLKYDPEEDTWTELEDRMRIPKSSHTALLVSADIFPEC